jgi:membrane fusion protein, multidrug efflux system
MSNHLHGYAAFVALSLLGSACSSGSQSPGASPGAEGAGRGAGRGSGTPVPVLTARAEQKAVPVTVPAVGTVEATSSVQVRAQVTGQLTAVHFTEGRDVRQGDPLLSLDPRPFQVALLQAEAVLARDSATLQNAQAQQSRNDALFQKGLLSRDIYESQRATVAALAATVAADNAAIETAKLNLKYTEIAAPISGRTGALGAHVGDLIRANDTTPLVVINQLSPIYVTFSVPGRYLSDIRRYQSQKPLGVGAAAPGALAPEAAAGRGTDPESAQSPAARGTLTFIDNSVDATTGTIRLKATFPNGDGQLWPGAFVRVTLDLMTQEGVIVVPVTAVQTSQDGQFVYVVTPDRTAEMRPVKMERQQGGEAVMASGISAGEEVVTDGQLRLVPGARVTQAGARGSGSGPSEGRRGGQSGRGR